MLTYYSIPSVEGTNRVSLLMETLLMYCLYLISYFYLFSKGGHAPMYDLPNNEVTNGLAAKVFENNGIVCAVCHGTAGKILFLIVFSGLLICLK